MGSSLKPKPIPKPKNPRNKLELPDQTLKLRERLQHALSLGIRFRDKKERRWQCIDVEIQGSAVRAMDKFVPCLSSGLLQHPLIKESVADILVALEGILQSENLTVLGLATSVAVRLVNILGSSICHYHIPGIVRTLSQLLSFHRPSIEKSSAIALKCILTNIGSWRLESQNELWKAVKETNTVERIVCALKDYEVGIQPHEYFIEIASLLNLILYRWPLSRYSVWSDIIFMDKLGALCANPDSIIVISALQLCSSLALCSDGAMKFLESKEPIVSKMVMCIGISQPNQVRIEALKLCQNLLRSEKGCTKLTSLCCEPIVKGIIDAMGGWRTSSSRKVPSDQMPLVIEACRSASMTRWPGVHHICFSDLGIHSVLLDLLLGTTCKVNQCGTPFLFEELVALLNDNITSARNYLWDILGWLAIHCEEDFRLKNKKEVHCINILISCACSVYVDLMGRGRDYKEHSPYSSSSSSELEPVARAVLYMVFSPCQCISSQSRHFLSEALRPVGDNYLELLFYTLEWNSNNGSSVASDNLEVVLHMICLACHTSLLQYQNPILERNGIQKLVGIIKRCLNTDVRISRSSIAPHLHDGSIARTCCWNNMEDWDGEDIVLLYCLQALSQLIHLSDIVCHNQKISAQVPVGNKRLNSDSQILFDSLLYILNNNISRGIKWYAAYILSFFGLYGFPSRLGKRMGTSIHDHDLADVQLILSNAQALEVHGVILMAACPSLLPSQESPHVSNDKDGFAQHERSFKKKIRLSDHVDPCTFSKLLEYIYTGICQVDENLVKSIRVLAKHCGLKSLIYMLQRKLPKCGAAIPKCDLTVALGPVGYIFSDIILEAKETGVDSPCSECHLSTPHVHAHKIILSSNSTYLKALFHSGMLDSQSQIMKVPIGWKALVKLVNWFYSGELPRLNPCCTWKNMDMEQQLHDLQPYVELCWLAEFWCLDDMWEESFNVVVSCLKSLQDFSLKIIQFAVNLSQQKIVEVAVRQISPLYPRMRETGELEELDENMVDLLRVEYIRFSQEGYRSD